MALIAPPKEYEPLFDETTGLYKDIMPWPKHFRGPKDQYVCQCNQFEFGSNTKFNQHIKSKCHQKWLAQYGKQEEEANKEKKEVKIDLEKKQRLISSQAREIAKKEKELRKVCAENEELKKKMYHLEEYLKLKLNTKEKHGEYPSFNEI